MPVTDEVLDALERPLPASYRLECFRRAIPLAYQADVGVLEGLVNADAPTGDAHVEPVPVPPEDYRADVALLHATGRDILTTLALTQDGLVVGYTVLQSPSDPRCEVYQQGTLVLAEHRGHGLGLALKVANLRTLQALDRSITAIPR